MRKKLQRVIYSEILDYSKEYLQSEQKHYSDFDLVNADHTELASLVSEALADQLEHEMEYMVGHMIDEDSIKEVEQQ